MKRTLSLLLIAAFGGSCAVSDKDVVEGAPGVEPEGNTPLLTLSQPEFQQPEAEEIPSITFTLRLIAADFVNALRQLNALNPANTTIHLAVDHSDDAFILAVRDALSDAGYAVRWTQRSDRAYLLQYRTQLEASNRQLTREVYELAVGGIDMRRTYATDLHGRVGPQTPMFIRGADATGIILDDSVFEGQPDSGKPLQLSSRNQDKPQRQAVATASSRRQAAQPLQAGTDEIRHLSRADISPLDPLVSGASPRPVSLPLVTLPVTDNVFDRGASNFDDLLSRYNIVDEQVLTFANDSLRLGKFNKQLLARMVKRFQKDTDMFSVLGCSMGHTAVAGGNAALALGRANRVVEALLFAGISTERILDEGCWAGSRSIEELPARGVVVTLNRRGA